MRPALALLAVLLLTAQVPYPPPHVPPSPAPYVTPWYALTEEERQAVIGIALAYGPLEEALAGRTYRLTLSPWTDGDAKVGAGVHALFDRPQTIETEWPGGWPFGGRYRVRHVSELIAMVHLGRGEVVRMFGGPGSEREPDPTKRLLDLLGRVVGPFYQFFGRH